MKYNFQELKLKMFKSLRSSNARLCPSFRKPVSINTKSISHNISNIKTLKIRFNCLRNGISMKKIQDNKTINNLSSVKFIRKNEIIRKYSVDTKPNENISNKFSDKDQENKIEFKVEKTCCHNKSPHDMGKICCRIENPNNDFTRIRYKDLTLSMKFLYVGILIMMAHFIFHYVFLPLLALFLALVLILIGIKD